MTRARTVVLLPLWVVLATAILLAATLMRTPVVQAPTLPAANQGTQTAPRAVSGSGDVSNYGSAEQQPASLAPIAPVAAPTTQAAPVTSQCAAHPNLGVACPHP